MAAPHEILTLIARFEEPGDAYKSGQYNEAQLRDATDAQIGQLVYEFYGLTNDKIKIVEAATA